jgi:hypothetical protein
MISSSESLSVLLSRLKDWLPIPEFKSAMSEHYSSPRSTSGLEDYRAKKGDQKKLRDEVAPILHYVEFARLQGEIRFPFDNDVPDCWIRGDASTKARGIEVTVAQSREGYQLGRELNEKGEGRGFIGLPDDASKQNFLTALAKPQSMYSTDQALQAVSHGVKRCLEKKDDQKYVGFDLLIEAPLGCLPNERWSRIQGDLCSAASKMPFREIHVIGDRRPAFGFRIK